MKKFFTLCLAFMLASLLNVNAADTYTLVGDLNGWNTSAEGYNFTYVQATDSYVLEGVTLKGEFKIVKNNSWGNPAFGSNGNSVPLDAAYIMWNTDAGNMVMIDGKDAVYNDCKLELKVLSAKNASLRITSSTAMQSSFDTRADVWCVAGSFSNDNWGDANEMTALGNGVYEFWSTELPSEFKFKAKGNWDISLGIHNEIKNTPIMGFDNAVDNGGANIKLVADQAYDKYRYTLTVRGWVASFRVDGYKEAVPSLTRVFYESFDKNTSQKGGVDNAWSGSIANGSWASASFDVSGWTSENGYHAYKCIKLGAAKKKGVVTTPKLGVTGDAELRFKAGAWQGDGITINITINNGGTLSASSVTLVNEAFSDYTINISDATPESTITFSAKNTNDNRFFLDEVEVYAVSTPLTAAAVTVNGAMKDANTAYYHNTLQTPSVTIALPAGATHMDIEVDNNGWIDEYLSAKGKTEDYTIEFYSTGNFTINVTAYGEGVYSKSTKTFAIEQVSGVYTFDELINKGIGAVGYLNFSPTVVAQTGKYLYLEGYDMWDGIRSSALVYATLDKTYKKGDILQGFIATVSTYNGNTQLVPMNPSLGDSFGYSEPYTYEMEAGEAWTAFATAENQNKYVRVKNATLTADAVDGVAIFNRFNVTMPEDLTKKYDVEGILGVYNNNIQIYPLSYTVIEEKIEPFTYTELVPADQAEVTSLSEIKITFPYEVAYDSSVAMGVLVMDGANMVTPTVTVEGAVATLTFDAITAYGSKPSLMVMAGAFKETTSNVGCQKIMASWTIPTPPITYDLAPVKVTPASGSTVEKLEKITLQVSEDVYDCRWAAQSYGNDFITVTDDKGNSYNGKLGYTSYTEYYYLYVENATAPGTYTITVKEGVFGDEQYLKKFEKGHANPEFTLTYTIKAAALAAPTVSPANGAEIESPSTITLTFAEAVTVNAEAGELTMVNTGDPNYDKAKNFNVTISEDGLTATITSEPGYLDRWATNATYKLNIPAGYFVGASGAASEALEYSWKVVPARFTYTAVTPAQGDVEFLETIYVDFGGFRPRVIDGYSYPTYNLVDAEGNTVTTATTNYDYEKIGDTYYYKLKVTLGAKVTTPGDYFLTIPAGVFKDKDVFSGYNENAEMTFKWTVAEAVKPLAAPTVDPANGAEVENLNTITLTFAEAVTANAEVGAITLVRNSDAAYDKQEAVVTISEDGLTATLTCKPVYPSYDPKWYIGETYTMSIPEGYFVAASGAANEALSYSWKIAAAKFTYVDVTPAQGDVTELSEILIGFANRAYGNSTLPTLNLVDANGNVVTTATTARAQNANGDWYAIKATLKEKVTTPGTYTLVVPADVFKDVDFGSGTTNAAFNLTWTVKTTEEVVEDFTPVVTPAAGEVTALEVLNTTIALPAKFASFDKTIDDYYNEIYFIKPFGKIWSSMLGHVTTSEDGLSINITWDFTPEEGAEYTLVIPAGNIVLENGAKNLETQITYTIKAAEVVEDFTPVVSPAAGEITVDQMNETVITFDTPISSFDGNNVRYIKAAGGNVWFFGTSKISEDKLTLTLTWDLVKSNYPVGTSYTLDLPAGCIVLENGAKNLETRIDYTLVAPDNTVYDYAPVTVSPANGSEVESLEKIYVSFPYGVYDCLWAALNYSTDFIKVSDENGNTYEAKIGYGSYTEDYYIYVKDATAPGKYTIVVPKGLVFDEEYSDTFESGHANPEFTLTYTLVAPVVEDFTPVVNPAAGNVTKEQIKTTVLSFESPIASFDNSDVRYAKNFGSVWCSVAGSYTIAEDKLSLTINWDFSPEVGLGYTLELPAGCIVLENGAKNLFTQVAYTVVAGPKDLAEFVVPAGINGYINYDETDVNAWAPEFPFTVSTTAYNTVAFTAELPSLPAGITAMEVIDENGEVIATLNQDGVAPLADGEIYYVKGETTKEYADGAELKFRFRFTHLGVSETIQFSYKVAGGNITSIADVELDGNVIVRGNDIIAPEGAAIFTVSGIRVPAEGLAPGVYVVVLGNQAVKVMVK